MRTRTGGIILAMGMLACTARAQIAGHPVISELYGAGGNIGAVYRNDFVELYNPTAGAVSLAGWSLQYASATGTGAWHALPLGGSIAAYGFYLVQLAGGTSGIALPPPDTSGSTNISATAGKVALVRALTPLQGANPHDSTIIDLVGYGSADGFEGSAPAPSPGTAVSIERKATPGATDVSMAAGGADEHSGNGWDTNNNGADFVAQKSINPQNSASPAEKPPDDLLPIRFGSLSATSAQGARVFVSWTTLSETACYGFVVERSGQATSGFAAISGLIPGHGTTLEVHTYGFSDDAGRSGMFYRIREIDTNGAEWLSETVEAAGPASARETVSGAGYSLSSFPNPFNPATSIRYHIEAASHVRLVIYDSLGRFVTVLADGKQTPGDHDVQWDAEQLPAGIYFCRLEAGEFRNTIRIALVR